MNILLAHHNASYLEAMKQILRAQGDDFQAEGVTSLEACFERAAMNGYDVVLLDNQIFGNNLDYFLRSLPELVHRQPVVVMVEESDEELAQTLAKASVASVIMKKKGYLSLLPAAIKEACQNKTAHNETVDDGSQTEQSERLIVAEPAGKEGFFICDRKGRFLSANMAIFSLLKYSEEEMLELTLTDLLPKGEETEFFQKLHDGASDSAPLNYSVQFIDKLGDRHPVDLKIRALMDEATGKSIIGFRGQVFAATAPVASTITRKEKIDQKVMINHILDTIYISYSEPLGILLKRIAEIAGQIYGFQRATVALLDRRRKTFVKHAMVGYATTDPNSIERRVVEVPQEVIDRIFADSFKIKVLYQDQDQRDHQEFLSPGLVERRTQKRREENEWHKHDLVLLKLADHRGQIFGYISLDEPLDESIPTRTTFQNLEIFGQLISMVIENYYRFSTLERRSRRLKQVLITSNIFKLYLSLGELLKEVVWSIKFSLEFNLVSLVLISKKSGQLETKSVATDDKIKLLQINELKYELKEFSDLLKDEYRRGKSYLISSEEPVLKHFKQIYYGVASNGHYVDGWPRWALLLVPIKSREGKIIGFIMADDPVDARMPNSESISILEILANQVAIAIDNRMLYVQAKEQLQREPEQKNSPPPPDEPDDKVEDYSSSGLRRLVDKFLR